MQGHGREPDAGSGVSPWVDSFFWGRPTVVPVARQRAGRTSARARAKRSLISQDRRQQAATRIQSVHRGGATRRGIKARRRAAAEQRLCDEDAAAARIQRAQGKTALPASGPRPVRAHFFEFYRAARVRPASGPRPLPFPPGALGALGGAAGPPGIPQRR
eukprot:gene19456-biopygen6985